MSKGSNQDQNQPSGGPDLDADCLLRLSEGDKSHCKQKRFNYLWYESIANKQKKQSTLYKKNKVTDKHALG